MKRHSGFAVIELPLVILIFGLALLVVTFVIYFTSGRLAWFFAGIGGLSVFLAAAMLIFVGFWPERNE